MSVKRRSSATLLLATLLACAGEAPSGSDEGKDATQTSDHDDRDDDIAAATEVDVPDDTTIADVGDVAEVHDDDVLGDPLTRCPELFEFTPVSTPCIGEFGCDYLPRQCCGETGHAGNCTCERGLFSCTYFADTCWPQPCSSGCGRNEFATPDGCVYCGTAIATFFEQVFQMSDELSGRCDADDECAIAEAASACGTVCDVAVRLDTLQEYVEQVTALGQYWCVDVYALSQVCGYPAHTNCGPRVARCVNSRCMNVSLCDLSVVPVNSPCDDQNACTGNDVCKEDGLCLGATIDCDDGDEFTIDSCVPRAGCVSTPGF